MNIGCGATPTDGWVNFDNSLVVRAARWPVVNKLVKGMWASGKNIRFANAARRIPCPGNSVEVLYSSHMIEHLDRGQARAFLLEVRRILRPGGIVRLAVPDLERLVKDYLNTGDADEFISGTHMAQERPSGILQRMRFALIGPRNHLWMYDGRSLTRLLSEAGFTDVTVMPAGITNIAEPGSLDLEERAHESVYVEAAAPAAPAPAPGCDG